MVLAGAAAALTTCFWLEAVVVLLLEEEELLVLLLEEELLEVELSFLSSVFFSKMAEAPARARSPYLETSTDLVPALTTNLSALPFLG